MTAGQLFAIPEIKEAVNSLARMLYECDAIPNKLPPVASDFDFFDESGTIFHKAALGKAQIACMWAVVNRHILASLEANPR